MKPNKALHLISARPDVSMKADLSEASARRSVTDAACAASVPSLGYFSVDGPLPGQR
jgi:hypothetical protein